MMLQSTCDCEPVTPTRWKTGLAAKESGPPSTFMHHAGSDPRKVTATATWNLHEQTPRNAELFKFVTLGVVEGGCAILELIRGICLLKLPN